MSYLVIFVYVSKKKWILSIMIRTEMAEHNYYASYPGKRKSLQDDCPPSKKSQIDPQSNQVLQLQTLKHALESSVQSLTKTQKDLTMSISHLSEKRAVQEQRLSVRNHLFYTGSILI